jgi:hypothetical protein
LEAARLIQIAVTWMNCRETGKIRLHNTQFGIKIFSSAMMDTNLRNKLFAPPIIHSQDFKKGPRSLGPKEWFTWMRTMELFARMGVIEKIPTFMQQANELREMLLEGDGLFPLKPDDSQYFQKWNTYSGLALEENWSNNRWKYDLTFRSLLILKYADML